jgi:dihydrofolate reductase
MSKVVYWMTVSLDGFVETRDGKIDWSAPDDELFRFHIEDARRVGAFLHGRRMYEGMASVWPTADQNPSFSEDHREFGRIWTIVKVGICGGTPTTLAVNQAAPWGVAVNALASLTVAATATSL